MLKLEGCSCDAQLPQQVAPFGRIFPSALSSGRCTQTRGWLVCSERCELIREQQKQVRFHTCLRPKIYRIDSKKEMN